MSRDNTENGKTTPNHLDRMKTITIFFSTMLYKITLTGVTYAITVLDNFTLIHTGSMEAKIKAVTKVGVLLSPFLLLIESIIDNLTAWSIGNSTYIQVVLMAIIIDHVLGSIKHLFWTKDFSMKKNLTGIVIKVGLTIMCGFLFEGLNHLITEKSIVKDYLTITTRCVVFLYPAGSAFSNSSVISGGKFPPVGWMNKLKRFQTHLDPKDFQQPNPPTQ